MFFLCHDLRCDYFQTILFSVDATVLEKVLDEHVSHGIEDVSDVSRVCSASEVDEYLLKLLNCAGNFVKVN